MIYEFELYSPGSDFPEIGTFEASCHTEAGNLANSITRNLRAELVRNTRVETNQDRAELQYALTWIHITFGPPVERDENGEITYEKRK